MHGVGLSYVLDLAEIPTFQEQSRVDADGDGQVSDAECGHGARPARRRDPAPAAR